MPPALMSLPVFKLLFSVWQFMMYPELLAQINPKEVLLVPAVMDEPLTEQLMIYPLFTPDRMLVCLQVGFSTLCELVIFKFFTHPFSVMIRHVMIVLC